MEEEHPLKKRSFERIGAKVLKWMILTCFIGNARALELDWSGQFWAEFNFVHSYSMDASDQGSGLDSSRYQKGGYYAPGGGAPDATFETLFLRLKPKVIVNDNIYIKSEWWVGDPIYGIFGSGLPYSTDQKQYYSYNSRGSIISAQRLWGEFLTDIGTFQVGRAPLSWGLGVVWNSGDNLWDRYMSTGDTVRWVAKFGSFSFVPSFILSSVGNNIGGSCNWSGGTCRPGVGTGGVSDYSLILKYENTEDELEGGINVVKRLAGANQDSNGGMLTPQGSNQTNGSMNFMLYDVYAKKKFSTLSLGLELPITSGQIASANYQAYGAAGEVDFKPTDSLDFMLKLGYASGQTNMGGNQLDTLRAFAFNPNYHVAMIMFNYQLANFSGAQTLNSTSANPGGLSSPYDNPIVNAAYASLSTQIKPWDKWTFRPAFAYAFAPQTAAAGQYFYNYWTRTVQMNNSGMNQDKTLGYEFDLGITFQWDEYFTFSLDNGIFFPGGFYAFSNTSTPNATNPVIATSARIGVSF